MKRLINYSIVRSYASILEKPSVTLNSRGMVMGIIAGLLFSLAGFPTLPAMSAERTGKMLTEKAHLLEDKTADRAFPVVLAGLAIRETDGTMTLKTVAEEVVRLSFEKQPREEIDGKPVMVAGIMVSPHTASEVLRVSKLKVLESLDQAGRFHEDLDAGRYRIDQTPARVVSKTADGCYVMDNVRWGFERPSEGRKGFVDLRPTKIDTSKVRASMYVLAPFPPELVAGHAFLMFEVDRGGVTSTGPGGKIEESMGLVLSVEAMIKLGDRYGMLKGLKKSFFNVYSLCTLEDRMRDELLYRKRTLRRFSLDLTPEQNRELLCIALDAAGLDHSSEFYNTYLRNCANSVIKLINMVAEKERRVREWVIPRVLYNPRATLPAPAAKQLLRSGLSREESPALTPDDWKAFKGWYELPVAP